MLSSDDPVRVFQQFATLDLLSGGRAEIMAGRGSFIESFPLFGYDLADYDDLFAEKLDLLLRLREAERRHLVRAPCARRSTDVGVYPRPTQEPLPVWIAVGGNPASAARAGALGLPHGARDHRRDAGAVRAVRGDPPRARRARPGTTPLPLSINSHGFIADTSQAAADASWPQFNAMMTKIGRERGWPPMSAGGLRGVDARCAARTSSAARRRSSRRSSSSTRSSATSASSSTSSSLDHAKTMRAIELYGTEVAPAVRAEVARRASTTLAV